MHFANRLGDRKDSKRGDLHFARPFRVSFSEGTGGGVRWGAKPRGDNLSARERQVLKLIAEGATNREIGRLLAISVHTVERHRANILSESRKSGDRRTGAICHREGISCRESVGAAGRRSLRGEGPTEAVLSVLEKPHTYTSPYV